MVVRTPSSPVDDVVPADRPITVVDLLTFRAGYGFPSDFSLPGGRSRCSAVHPAAAAARSWSRSRTNGWRGSSRIPMLHQPGEAWLYNTCSDLQGVLIARVSGHAAARVPGRAAV